MSSASRRAVVFAREPAPGRVKTRLARALGDGPAAALYAAFLQDLAAALPDPARWNSVLAHAEPEAGPFLKRTFGSPWSLVPQGEGDLGERLERAFEGARADGVDVVVAGSDAPTLTRNDLAAAFAALENDAEIVFAPSPDGGFSLVGIAGVRPGTEERERRPGDCLEGVRWSTAFALEDARRAAERLGWRVQLLAAVPDVDEVEDLTALSSYLSKHHSLSLSSSSSSSSSLAPATRRALEALLQRRGA
jgi:rSAM/selenodomain-associated transferase 1